MNCVPQDPPGSLRVRQPERNIFVGCLSALPGAPILNAQAEEGTDHGHYLALDCTRHGRFAVSLLIRSH